MNINKGLFDFISASPSAFHAVNTVKDELLKNGFAEIHEFESAAIKDGGKYFMIRNGTSLVAFVANFKASGFMITASHSDSPAFRLKLTPELCGAYTRLEVEKYGGMIYYSWLDRPLSLAGRVVARTERGIEERLVNIDRDIAVIPSVAIHMNRNVNEGYKFNPASDLLPLVGSAASKGSILAAVADAAGVSESDMISHDIFLYNREEGRTVGVNNEYILAPRIDDLACVFASLKAFLSAKNEGSVPVLAIFDNEEVGSQTKQGAASSFLRDALLKAANGASLSALLASSMMVSADNAHAKHPNHPELADPDNAPLINGGVVIKWNANQRYATDAVSDAIFKTVCERASVKTQSYYNRADMLGGSTLGSISDTVVSLPTIDIGLPQLAMHSASETAGASDLDMLYKALLEFYSTSLKKTDSGYEF